MPCLAFLDASGVVKADGRLFALKSAKMPCFSGSAHLEPKNDYERISYARIRGFIFFSFFAHRVTSVACFNVEALNKLLQRF